MEEVEEPLEPQEVTSSDIPEDAESDIKDQNSDVGFPDSPEQDEQYNNCDSQANSDGFKFSTQSSLDATSTIEGELDFEDEMEEAKESSMSKDDLDDEQSTTEADQVPETSDFEKDGESIPKPDEEDSESIANPEEEDGEIPEEKATSSGELESAEEGEDDGELSDEDDLEEGEVKDASPSAKTQTKQVCRFFNRGQCTWGMLCRFLHVSVNDHGNYNMFAPSAKPFAFPGNGQMNQRTNLHVGAEFHPLPPPPLPPPPPQPPSIPHVPVSEPPPVESAWERGLRHAKELIKKSTQRKETEPDFEEKRLNLSLTNNKEQDDPEFDKENEMFGKPYRRQNEPIRGEEVDSVFWGAEPDPREYFHGGRYENFEVKWGRQDPNLNKNRRVDRTRNNQFPNEREKPKQWRGPGNKFRDERLNEIQTTRNRGDEWRDPWRRSKTPKTGKRSRSRGRSHASYSSVSSHSYSESYSRSSSRSSFYSSRSPSPNKPSTVKRKPSPRKPAQNQDKAVTKTLPYKKKPSAPLRRTASRSYTRSRSSHSRSSSSRSGSRTPSASRSRSYSRSLSMDSVSSASSSISRSSSRSGARKNPPPKSVRPEKIPPPKNVRPEKIPPPPRKVPPPPRKEEVKPAPPKPKPPPPKPPSATSSLFAEMQRLKNYDKMRDAQKAMESSKTKAVVPMPLPPKPKAAVPKTPPAAAAAPKAPTNTPVDGSATEQSKPPPAKNQIKLTLINKPPPPKFSNPLNKELETSKSKAVVKEEKPTNRASLKRPASPPPATNAATKAEGAHKRSTSSRRDELLKQLKAVEDAIARKRAKFS